MEQRVKTALVVKVVGQGYLSENGSIVDFNHAGIINSPVIAKGIARKFNAISMNSIGMKYDLEIELIELNYKATGKYITSDLEDD